MDEPISKQPIEIRIAIRNVPISVAFMPTALELFCESCEHPYVMRALDIASAYEQLRQHINIYHQGEARVIPSRNEYRPDELRRRYSEK